MALNLSVLAVILVLAPLFYLLLASPAFLLVSLAIPQVAYILRSVFSGYFLMLVGTSGAATILMAVEAKPVQSLCLGLLCLVNMAWRRWMMGRVDPLLAGIEAGLPGGGGPLRRLHWLGMLANAGQTALILLSIPALVAVP